MGKAKKQKNGSIGALIEGEQRSPRRKRGCLSRGIMGVAALFVCGVVGQAVGILPSSGELRATEQQRTSVALAREVQATASAPATLTLAPSQTPTDTATSTATETRREATAQPQGAAALFATATQKSTETAQPSPTATPTETASATATHTASATWTPTATHTATTAAASATPAPRLASGTVYTNGAANLRECPRTDCEIVAALGGGIGLPYDARVDGHEVNAGNAVWYRVSYAARTAYVYSGVVSTVAPAPVVNFQSAAPVSTPGGAVGNAWNCNGNLYNCPFFENRCGDLAAYWAACPGDPSKLDDDKDGRPCELTCP